MGEESIRRPPESKKAPITCAQASRAIGSLPTLKVIQLPSPTAGSSSPVEGIGLLRARACWEDASCARNSAAAPVAAKTRSSRRRLSGDICSIERSIEGAPSHDRGPRSDAPGCSCRAARVNGLMHKVDDDLLSATRILCKATVRPKDAIPSLSAIRVGLMDSCLSRYVHFASQRIDAVCHYPVAHGLHHQQATTPRMVTAC